MDQDHAAWLAEHRRRCRDRERWTDEDWSEARFLADLAWDERGLYVYDAENAIREQHYRRTAAELERQASFDLDWLLDVMGLARTVETRTFRVAGQPAWVKR